MTTRKLKLSNGLRVILAPHAGLAATVLVLVGTGSEYESRRINGLSHFLEHMCFKGTVNRPQPGMIATELDSLGAEYNAFTGQEYTGYWAKAENHKLPQILDIVSDLYLNPVFNKAEIEKERGVVIEEMNLYEDTPMWSAQDLFMTVLYGDQPAGWRIVGKKEIIQRLDRKDFLAYRKKHYIAPATIVVVAGNFDLKKISADIKRYFGKLPRAAKPAKPKTSDRQAKPQILLKFKDSDQSHLVLGARAFSVFDERRFALQVAADILGGGMSSRLWHRVREELGAAYYIRSSAEFFIDHGYLDVSAGVDHRKIELVIRAVVEELRRLRDELIEAKELKKSKDHLIGRLILGLETSDEVASFYGGQEVLTGTFLNPQKTIEFVRKVTAEEIRAVARSIFTANRLNLAVIGPYKKSESFRKILKF